MATMWKTGKQLYRCVESAAARSALKELKAYVSTASVVAWRAKNKPVLGRSWAI